MSYFPNPLLSLPLHFSFKTRILLLHYLNSMTTQIHTLSSCICLVLTLIFHFPFSGAQVIKWCVTLYQECQPASITSISLSHDSLSPWRQQKKSERCRPATLEQILQARWKPIIEPTDRPVWMCERLMRERKGGREREGTERERVTDGGRGASKLTRISSISRPQATSALSESAPQPHYGGKTPFLHFGSTTFLWH